MNRTKRTYPIATAVLWMAITAAVYALGMIVLYVSSGPDRLFWSITSAYVVFGVLCGLLAGRSASIPGMLLGSAAAYAILSLAEHDLVSWLVQDIAHSREKYADVIFVMGATYQSTSIFLFLLAALLTAALVRWRRRQRA